MSDPSEPSAPRDDARDPEAFGTAALDAPVSRADLERALRHLNLTALELRDGLMQLGARVVTLIDEVTRRVDGVEPEPAPPGTPAVTSGLTVEQAVAARTGETLTQVRAADARTQWRVLLDTGASKYETPSAPVPCAELLPLCQARCCTLDFALSPEDLDEGVVRWDYGQPYRIRQRQSDRYCVHCDPDTRHCTVHERRPRTCRIYDCSNDPRIWIDFARRIPATADATRVPPDPPPVTGFDLMERVRLRTAATSAERLRLATSFAEPGPRRGPVPALPTAPPAAAAPAAAPTPAEPGPGPTRSR